MDDFIDFLRVVLIVFVLVAVICLGLIHFEAIGKVEQYNALVSLVKELGIDARTEDILGKVADWNMSIADAKRYNKIPIVQFFIPDKLANLDPISVPK